MKIQNEHHSFTGMQRDLQISKHPASFLYDARNIRLTQRNDDTLLAVTNEKGTEDLNIEIMGDYLGHCLLNEWLVVFSTTTDGTTIGTDYIERINLSKVLVANENPKTILFQGNLNFSPTHPIEAIGSYENESVQKVYWTDGLNQPRIINITPERIGNSHTGGSIFYAPEDASTFDFVREIDLNAVVTVKKVLGASGIFPGGVIQYAFTYYDKFGQESNVFYTTPLLYTSYNDRGVSSEDRVNNAFEITISNLDWKYDFVRIYSIMRTSINGTPICKRVQDLDIGPLRALGNTSTRANTLTFVDTNTTGEAIDPTELLYKGGEEIVAQTIEQKDGTLFLGNINITRPNIRNVDFTNTNIEDRALAAANAVESVRIVEKAEASETTTPRRSAPVVDRMSGDIIDDSQVVEIVGGHDMELLVDNEAVAVIDKTELTASDIYVITPNTGDPVTVVVDTDTGDYIVDETYTVTTNDDGDYEVDTGNDDPVIIVSRKGDHDDYEVATDGYVISVARDGKDILLDGGGYVIAVDNGNNTGTTGHLETEGGETYYVNGGITVECDLRNVFFPTVDDATYTYNNQLTGYRDYDGIGNLFNSVPCGGFKRGDYYRLGCQFQYKNGKWSEPVFIGDMQQTKKPSFSRHFIDPETHEYISDHVSLPIFKGHLNSAIAEDLYDLGYRRVRAVVVFPEMYDRVTLCQGVTCPTLYTQEHRYLNKDVYSQASWFFRPYLNTLDFINSEDSCTVSPAYKDVNGTDHVVRKYLKGTSNTFNGDFPDYNPTDIRSVEIQGSFDDSHAFIIDDAFCTFHSPDIEFDDRLWLMDFNGTKKRCVGDVLFTKTLSDINIQIESALISSMGSGFVHKSFIKDYSYGIVSGLFWDDVVIEDNPNKDEVFVVEGNQGSSCKWFVYPWNKNGSLNNDIDRPTNLGTRCSVLKKKVISNLRYAGTVYSENIDETSCDTFNFPPQIFREDQLSILKFQNAVNSGNSTPRAYMGNIDTLLVPDKNEGMYFAFSNWDTSQGAHNVTNLEKYNEDTPFNSNYVWKITAKNLTVDNNVATLDGGIWRYGKSDDRPGVAVNWHWSAASTRQDIGNQYYGLLANRDFVRMKYKSTPHMVGEFSPNATNSTSNSSLLRVYEVIVPGDDPSGSEPLYRATMFGGTSKDAFQANQWLPCGEPVAFDGTANVTFDFSYGDTYFQRWDCLKTYPFTREDINQIVEIGSFMLETHVNIDGRYDRNRGQLNNTNMSPVNFNLLNSVYSQVDNFYTYRILDSKFYLNNSFPNQFTWTKEKQAGADIDLWTNITLASTYDLDGSKGEIVSLNTWKDNIFCFQNKGISNILFNSRVQIPVSDGMPIEISNSYKVDGYKYLSDGIGCSNKWSIKETPAGVYFIDSVTNDLHHIGEGIANLSQTHNMKTWFKDASVDKTVYDEVNHDIYLINSSDALCYSEVLGNFSSFYDYEGINLIESYNTDVFTMKDKRLYKMFTGEYNMFFDYPNSNVTPKPWYITFISNGADSSMMDEDKIFSNLDYRMEMYSKNNTSNNYDYIPNESFDKIRVWNEYQDSGTVNLNYPILGTPTSYDLTEANLEKKYKIWRVQLPREANSMNRIRNPWCKITLQKNNTNTDNSLNKLKAVLQDLNVQYYI